MLSQIRVCLFASLLFASQYSVALVDASLKSKLTDLMYLAVPLVFIVSTFFIAEWKRKNK